MLAAIADMDVTADGKETKPSTSLYTSAYSLYGVKPQNIPAFTAASRHMSGPTTILIPMRNGILLAVMKAHSALTQIATCLSAAHVTADSIIL
jgi:hypothetical protein